MEAAVKCFEDDGEKFRSLVVEIGETLFNNILKFREVIGNEIFSLFSLSLVS